MLRLIVDALRAAWRAFVAPRQLAAENVALRHQLDWDAAPRYMIRDRDSIYGDIFRGRVKSMGINEVLIAPRSPWQSPYVERLIGSIRRELLDHVIVLDERHLRRILREYIDAYYRPARTHLSLGKDSPIPRPVQPPGMGKVVSIPVLGGLHHRYERRAA